jgi:hypothetical protein
VLASWRKAAPGSLQIIGKDMTDAAMQALQDTILGADLGEKERKMVSEVGTAFLSSTDTGKCTSAWEGRGEGLRVSSEKPFAS